MFQLKNPNNTKEKILYILSVQFPLTTRNIHNLLLKNFSSGITYQAVHKNIRELVEEGILERKGREYSIDIRWVKEFEDFIDAVKNNYEKGKSLLGIKEDITKDDFRFITFDNLASFDRFLFDFEKKFHSRKGDKIVVWKAKHYYWPLAYSKQMFDVQKYKDKKGYRSVKVFTSPTKLDKWVKDFYGKLGVKTEVGKGSEQYDLAVYNDTVIRISICDKVKKKLHDVFHNNESITDLDLEKIFRDVFEMKCEVKVVIQENKEYAGVIREELNVMNSNEGLKEDADIFILHDEMNAKFINTVAEHYIEKGLPGF